MTVDELWAVCDAARAKGLGYLSVICREPGDRSVGINGYEAEIRSAGCVEDLDDRGRRVTRYFEIGLVS